ncbi:hypothetical protein ACROYT_G043814 [Oculina patagonica]
MYMDDIMTSLETDDEAVKACDQLIELLGKAGFKIRRWCSNNPNVLEDIPLEDRVVNVNIEESELPCMKALGVQWNAKTDTFAFKLNPPKDTEYTKRGFFKKRATLLDPLQKLAPFTIRARMAMQETWLLGLGWDDEFPAELRKKCQEWFSQLPDLSGVQGQSRRYKTFVANRVSEIHQRSNPRQWRHVPTDMNCADDATRGLHAKELTMTHRWFSGPEFLYEEEDAWPQRKRVKQEDRSDDCLAEITKPKMTFATDASQP